MNFSPHSGILYVARHSLLTIKIYAICRPIAVKLLYILIMKLSKVTVGDNYYQVKWNQMLGVVILVEHE
jgi:hypothetical protein